MRGNPSISDAPTMPPACAGEPMPCRCAYSVYPRVCGGTGVLGCALRRLSPRVRGNLQFRGRCGEVYPRVCGGTRRRWLSPWRRLRGLSPRVRGNRYDACTTGHGDGLSPRVRGNRLSRDDETGEGSIPVCGGTLALTSSVYSRGLSPRVRGNLAGQRLGTLTIIGLSPRVRGNHAARAYNMMPLRRVYPRVCGGTGFKLMDSA